MPFIQGTGTTGERIVRIPENVDYIIKILEENGFEAYAVGGCVRDMVMGREPDDWDITTSAEPLEVKALFHRTIDTGIQHGTVTVMIGNEGYEVTTYRRDGDYEDHRHPSAVVFTPNLLEDLKRRDFTINAMAFNPTAGIVDEFEGIQDIQRKCIRCVGEAGERFEEDALRMLRGIRFAAQLEFGIEVKTLSAIREKAPTLVNVSAERIRTELTKLLLADASDRLMFAVQTGLSRYFLPELDAMIATSQNNPHHCFDVGNHSLEAVRHINRLWKKGDIEGIPREEKDHIILVYAALLHDVSKPGCRITDDEGIDHFHNHNELAADKAEQILKRLKFDNDTISLVTRIIRYHDSRHENCLIDGEYSPKGKRAMRRLMNRIGSSAMPYLFALQRADLLAQSDYDRTEKLAKLEAAQRCYQEICLAGEAVTRKDLAISGRDLQSMGIQPGPEMGKLLERLLETVLEDPSKNTAEELRKLVDMYM